MDTAADLSLTKTALPPLVTAGELLTYTITVSNAGPSAAQDVLVRDDLPAALLGTEFSVNGGPFSPWFPLSGPDVAERGLHRSHHSRHGVPFHTSRHTDQHCLCLFQHPGSEPGQQH